MCDELLSDEELYGDYEPPYLQEPLDFDIYLEQCAAEEKKRKEGEQEFIEHQSQFNMTADFFMLPSSEGMSEPDVWGNYSP